MINMLGRTKIELVQSDAYDNADGTEHIAK